MGCAIYRKTADGFTRIRNVRHNTTNGGYQKWSGYPDSPVLSSVYPYQAVDNNSTLFMAENPMYMTDSYIRSYHNSTYMAITIYTLSGGAWVYVGQYTDAVRSALSEANGDIYTDNSYTAVGFEKTTTPPQDAGASFVRDRAMYHKDTTWKRVNI